MRKISSKYEIQKKRKRNQWIVGGLLIFLMFASVLGYAVQGNLGSANQNSNDGNFTYNGFEFENVNGFWVLGNFVFAYNPNEVSDISTENLRNFRTYENKTLYLYSEVPQAESEIRVNLGQVAKNIENACPAGEGLNCSQDVRTCNDNFIIIQSDNINEITQEDGCVFIKSTSENGAVRNADQFLFKTLGIR